jgi:bacterioferritin-associated ferredoxin
MDLDDHVCLCFRVSRRKLESFARRSKPKVPSQLSECGGAGTGCGWCVPFLRQLFDAQTSADLDALSAEEYANRRADYLREGRGKPPPSVDSPILDA